VFAFENGAVAVNVIKTFGEVVVVFLRTLAHTTRAIALAWPSPGTFVKRYSKDSKIRTEIIEIGMIWRSQESANADKGRYRLTDRHRCAGDQTRQ
jgi:hypothetical protein